MNKILSFFTAKFFTINVAHFHTIKYRVHSHLFSKKRHRISDKYFYNSSLCNTKKKTTKKNKQTNKNSKWQCQNTLRDFNVVAILEFYLYSRIIISIILSTITVSSCEYLILFIYSPVNIFSEDIFEFVLQKKCSHHLMC